jgi:hypothetical protein
MRPYGVHRADRGCCPGHDKYPPDKYSSRRSQRARAKGIRKSHGRARAEANDDVDKRIEQLIAGDEYA